MSVPLVSMTHSKIPKRYRLKQGKLTFAKFCEDDRPLRNTGEFVGMADQAIYKAQKKTRSTHLLDVLVMKEGDCVTVEGFAAKALKVKKRKKRRRRASRKTATVSDEGFDWTDEVLPADEESSQSPIEPQSP